MTTEKMQLIVGGLLHDVGKVVYRQGDQRNHSVSGYEFLSQEIQLEEKHVLESVRYHHGAELENADISSGSFAYITYFADNIAAAADHRKKQEKDSGFDQTMPLQSVFNILNGNRGTRHYRPEMLGECTDINFPTEEEITLDEHFYLAVKQNLTDNFRRIVWEEEYLNSLLGILEENLSFIPSSTAKDEMADISLYDHLKLTAALCACIYDYLEEKQVSDYKDRLLEHGREFCKEKVFALFSMDISGIQNFIYTIHSEGALRNLRARSFYLEIMMEHVVDTLLERIELSRTNLIYSGGGHCYILMPNTKKTWHVVQQFEKQLNDWLTEQFDISLYMAAGLAECSALDLQNEPRGSYSDIFRRVSVAIGEKKSSRYTAAQIRKLNERSYNDYARECKVCKKLDRLTEEGLCKSCALIFQFSKDILYRDFFVIFCSPRKQGVPLPFGACLASRQEEGIEECMKQDAYIRTYGKNQFSSGRHIASRMWVGSYTTGDTMEELAQQAKGIRRVGILRADVDNLGTAFVSGFENQDNGDKYVTLSRTAALSRQLSMFFKYYINGILEHPQYRMGQKEESRRKATVVYSGGDDLFIVGAWDDILELSLDIQQAFQKYTEATLTISAGIGVYQPKFPIHVSAYEVADLEEESKMRPGKNAVTILPDGNSHQELDKESGVAFEISDGTYSWEALKEEVIGEKLRVLWGFFQYSEDRGKSFLYHLLQLVRGQEDKINLARYVYLLARMEPGEQASQEEKDRYQLFSRKMYKWIHSEEDCRQLKTAINLYAYQIRDKEEDEWR